MKKEYCRENENAQAYNTQAYNAQAYAKASRECVAAKCLFFFLTFYCMGLTL